METEKFYHIHAVILTETRAAHVHMSTSKLESALYKKAETGKIGALIDMANSAKDLGTHLSIYLLESYTTSRNDDAYYRCIAWEHLLQDAEYILQSDADKRQVSAMNSSVQQHYNNLRRTVNLDSLLNVSLDLVPGILSRRHGPRKDQKTRAVRVEMPAAIYDKLNHQARTHGLPLSKLLLNCATNMRIGPDLALISEYRQELGRCLSILQCMAAVSPTVADVQLLLPTILCIRRNSDQVTQRLIELSRNT